ncbi:MAG: hypothetical protein CMQ41_15625 [Gammaproteobacteria bacterium]|nr:hypothetical protein [Gammaproteobacteria bacterium]
MAGTVSVWIEGEADTLVEQRISKVARVYIRQVAGETSKSSHVPAATLPPSITARMESAQRAISTIGLDKGLFPSTIVRSEDKSNLLSFEFPYGPKRVQYGGHALQYTEIRRPGMKSLLRSTNPTNRTIGMNAVIADRTTHGIGSCEKQLQILKDMSIGDIDVEFVHGVVTFPARLRITGFSVDSVERTLQGEITKARVSLNLKESIPLNVEMVWLKAVKEEPKPIAVLPGEENKPQLEGTNMQEVVDPIIAKSGLTGLNAGFNSTTANLLGIL